MKTPTKKIYTTHGERKLIAVPVKVAGKRALGYVKGDKLIGYTPWEDVCTTVFSGNVPEYDPPPD